MGEPATAAVRLLSGEREPVRVATTGNILLQGLQTVDGVALAVNDRVLVKDQSDATLNGIYTASNGRWYRAPDANFPRAVCEGVTVQSQEGTTNGGKAWRFANTVSHLGTDPIQIAFYLSGSFAADAAAVIELLRSSLNELRDAVRDAATDAVSQGNVPIYGTALSLSGLVIPLGINAIRTNGYAAAGDGGEGLYVLKVPGSPAVPGDQASNGGAKKWELRGADINVRQFGARGDGVTDDTAAFMAAMSLGRPVFVPSSGQAYMVGTDAIELVSGSALLGIGRPTIKMKQDALSFAMLTSLQQRRKGIRIAGVVLDGNRENNIDHGTPDAQGNQPAGWQGRTVALVNVAYVDGFVLEDCEIKNCMSSGLWMSDCTAYRITDNWVHDYRHSGIATRNDSSVAGTTEKGIVSGNICEGGTVGIHSIFGVVSASVINNVCRNNKDANRFPSYAYSGTYPNVWPSTGGFKASGASGYVSPALLGDGAGIECTGVHNPPATSNQSLTITGNNCAGNMAGVRLEEVTLRCVVTGNKCTENEAYGIFVFASYYHAITGNSCTDNGVDGIHLEAFNGDACDCHAITGNVCTQNGRFGAYLGGASNNVISGNVLCPNNTNTALVGGGLGLFSADGKSCQRNAITGNTFPAYTSEDKYGIYSDSGPSGTAHQNNRATGNVFVGQTVAASNLNTALNPVV